MSVPSNLKMSVPGFLAGSGGVGVMVRLIADPALRRLAGLLDLVLRRPALSAGSAYCGPPRIEAGWPGSLKFLPVSVTVSPSTASIDRSESRKLPT
jgi:hypothetical protein